MISQERDSITYDEDYEPQAYSRRLNDAESKQIRKIKRALIPDTNATTRKKIAIERRRSPDKHGAIWDDQS